MLHFFTTDAPTPAVRPIAPSAVKLYIGCMKTSCFSLLVTAALCSFMVSPMTTNAQEAPVAQETTLATIEGPLTREGLNEVRLVLAEEDVKFNYGNFQFHPQTGDLVGCEFYLVVNGQEYRDYFDFTSEDCVLRILKESGFRMEGC